ncbi:MAG TPA: MBOAT family O-acyltransferase [Beijerinckiaceae bacterium]|jgi:alginate O-acetyltransferase complex protein AlgI
MVFSSVTFLFYFLPLFLLAFHAARRSKTVVAAFSIVFYAWGEPAFVVLLFGSILMNYWLGLRIGEAGERGEARPWLVLGVVLNLIPLALFKYGVFVLETLVAVAGLAPKYPVKYALALPLGISFFTFHALSYLIDVYRRDVRPERSLRDMILYIAMFPQLVAGPLVRYKTIASELHRPNVSLPRTADGIRLFVIGLAQKVLIANTVSVSADAVFALPQDQLSTLVAWVGIVCYTVQIYFDFAGYSNMAIGLALMIGFTFPVNFNYPYAAQSMTDFWRRWHISLSSWFRDYVYIPLGGNRLSAVRTYVNLAVVFLLCGIWHGAAWTFVLWGLAHGLLLVLERLGLGSVIARWPVPLRHAYVMLLVMATWVLFRADGVAQAFAYLGAMAGGAEAPFAPPLQRFLGFDVLLALAAAAVGAGPWGARLGRRALEGLSGAWRALGSAAELGTLATLFALVAMSLAGGAYNPFIYFRF